MDRCERIRRTSDLYHKLAHIEGRLASLAISPGEQQDRTFLMNLRGQMAAIEHQISLIRIAQSENRLRQQLFIAIPSLIGGSAITYLLQFLSK